MSSTPQITPSEAYVLVGGFLSESYAWTDNRQSSRFDEILDGGFELITPSGTMDRAAFVKRQTERENAAYDTRHVWSNLRVDIGDGILDAHFYQCAHVKQPGDAEATVEMMNVDDQWVWRADRWLLSSRRRFPAFE